MNLWIQILPVKAGQAKLKVTIRAKVNLVTLTNYEAVLDSALKTGYINEEDVPVLDNWRKDPAHWEAGK